MKLISANKLYKKLFTCTDGKICPDTTIDNFPICFDVKMIKKVIREAPNACDIDAIKNEIEQKAKEYDSECSKGLRLALEIINKYTIDDILDEQKVEIKVNSNKSLSIPQETCTDCKYYPNGIPCNDCEGYSNFCDF